MLILNQQTNAPTPRVSVVIATHNYARFLPQAVNSVLGQSLPATEVELIVVDDGSTDDTPAVLRGYEGGLRAIRQENRGQAVALNTGIAGARGEFVALLDADDYWYPTRLAEVLARFAADQRIGLVHHRLDVVDGGGRLLHTAPFRARLDEGHLRDQLLRYGGTWNALTSAATSAQTFRRSVLEMILPIPAEFRTMADGYLATQMALAAPVGAVHRSLAAYRLHGQNNWAPSELTADWIRRRQLTPLRRVSELVAARLPETEDVDVTRDRVYVEYLCLADKMEGRWGRALRHCGTLARALRHDARLGARDKLWRWLHAVALLALPANRYLQLKRWYSGNWTAYRLRQKWLADEPPAVSLAQVET